jgi:hypothetical protein
MADRSTEEHFTDGKEREEFLLFSPNPWTIISNDELEMPAEEDNFPSILRSMIFFFFLFFF